MIIKNGLAFISKKEHNAIREVLIHSLMDIGFGTGGSFGDGENYYLKEVERAKLGIELIKAILQELITVK